MSPYQRLFMIAAPTLRHTPAMERAVAIARATDAALHIAFSSKKVTCSDA